MQDWPWFSFWLLWLALLVGLLVGLVFANLGIHWFANMVRCRSTWCNRIMFELSVSVCGLGGLYYAVVWPSPAIVSAAKAAQWEWWAFLSVYMFASLLCCVGAVLLWASTRDLAKLLCGDSNSYTQIDPTNESTTVSQDFFFVPRHVVLEAHETLPRMQELRSRGWLKKRSVDLVAAFKAKGDDVQETLFISHRWESPLVPDTQGEQLRAIQQHLRKATHVKWIWYDFWCLPQRNTIGNDDRSSQDLADFERMLKAIADLYLSMRVLILLDLSYFGRFWTLLEAWCAMKSVTATGLKTAMERERRFAIACIHNAPSSLEATLVDLLASKSLIEARSMLAQPDIVVTNAKDKEQMLRILESIEAHVKQVFKLGLAEEKRLEARELEDQARKLREEAAQLEC